MHNKKETDLLFEDKKSVLDVVPNKLDSCDFVVFNLAYFNINILLTFN